VKWGSRIGWEVKTYSEEFGKVGLRGTQGSCLKSMHLPVKQIS